MIKRFLFVFMVAVLMTPAGITQAQLAGPQITSFSVTGGSFLIEGDMVTFNWTSSNASYCIADGSWSGNRDASGDYTLYMTSDHIGYANFGLTCYDGIGNKSSSAHLTPFVASSGTKKQSGSITVVGTDTPSTSPDDATIVAHLTETPQAAAIVLHEQTASPADFAEKVSMMLPPSEILHNVLTFRFDGPARPTAGKSYFYTVTAQGKNATDLTTSSGVITIDEVFKITKYKVTTSTMSDGSRLETEKNISAVFSGPAKNVKTQVSSMNDAQTTLTDDYVKTYEYPSYLYSDTQTGFAAGTFSGLKLGKTYQYVVEGESRASGKKASITGKFTTAPDIQVSDGQIVPSYTDAYITWKTNVPTGSAIEYYTTDPKNTQFAFSEQDYPQTFHKVTVKNLKPDTEYKAIIHAYIHNEGDEVDTTKKMSPLTFRTKVATNDMIVCPEVYEPVCGKDNKTHFNSCKAKAANTSVAYEGECKPFKISSFRVDKLDALGKATEEERSFAINTSDPFSKLVISLWEAPNTSITQAPYTTATIQGNGTLTSIYVSPGVFDKKLRPNKTYKYLVTAYKYGATEDITTSVEDTFTTSNFAPPKSEPITLEGRVYKAGDEPYETLYRDFGVSYKTSDFTGKLTQTLWVYEQPGDKLIAKKDLGFEHSFVSGLKPNTKYSYQYQIIDERGVTGKAEGTFETGTPPKPKEEKKAFEILSVRLEKQTQATVDGGTEPIENARDMYPTFSLPAKQVKLDVYRKKDNARISTYEYPEKFVTKDKTSFALSVFNLESATDYRYIITGRSQDTGEIARYEGVFSTVKFEEKKPSPELPPPPSNTEPPAGGVICGQAITYGRNKSTGQIRAFPTTCLPEGWEHVDYSALGAIELPKEGIGDKREQQARQIEGKVRLLTERKLDAVLSEIQQLRDKVKEQDSELKYLRKISSDVSKLAEAMQEALTTFVTYGVDSNTKDLGAGERAAVVRSYQSAYGKLPDSDKELEDMIRIANGRFPSERNETSEKRANMQFKRIFKRVANLKNDNDRAAIMVMAYGLRQAAENRNLKSESSGIITYKAVYGSVPQKTEEWNIMQAITYSGASRRKDTDKDLLADDDEKDYGTDPNNPDTDGDGFADGLEVENGFSPTGEGRLES